MSKTPRTDEAAEEIECLDYSDKGRVVSRQFAGELELEINELKQDIKILRSIHTKEECTDKLLPCPFCGFDAVIFGGGSKSGAGGGIVKLDGGVKCARCNVCTPSSNINIMIKLWNSREKK